MNASITLMCGLPACGKSSYLMGFNEIVILCPDDFRLVLTGKDFYAPAEDSVWSHVKVAARVLAKHYPVFIDATCLTIGSRAQWVRIAKDIDVPINCIIIDTPLEVCLSRNANRERQVPEDIIRRMQENYVAPTYEEGFDNIKTCTNESYES